MFYEIDHLLTSYSLKFYIIKICYSVLKQTSIIIVRKRKSHSFIVYDFSTTIAYRIQI